MGGVWEAEGRERRAVIEVGRYRHFFYRHCFLRQRAASSESLIFCSSDYEAASDSESLLEEASCPPLAGKGREKSDGRWKLADSKTREREGVSELEGRVGSGWGSK